MNHFKKGDVVVRTAGEWRGVKQGDVNVVSECRGMVIYLVGFDGYAFDHDNFELVNKTPVPAVSIDEAVEACKTARTEIEELEAKVKALKDSIKVYEVVLQRAGLKFI